jgi:hypothetical protein
MADDPITPVPQNSTVVPPPIEEWVAYTYDRINIGWSPSGMHPLILAASSASDIWNDPSYRYSFGVPAIQQILTAAVLDFREAYGAAFEEAAKDDKTLIPTSCLPYIDATIFYNVSMRFGLFTLKADGVTRDYLTDYFYQAWKDASVYRRAIATARRMYREEIGAIQAAEGTPVYIARTEGSARSL